MQTHWAAIRAIELCHVQSWSLGNEVDGVNFMRIPSKDAYAYGLALLDQLFTKEEQKESIALKSKKSLKPPLSPKRVEKMFGK